MGEHSAGLKSQFKAAAWLIGPVMGVGFLLWAFGGGFLGVIGGVFLTVSLLACVVFAVYSVIYRTVIETSGNAFGRVLMPSGSSTPPAKPLSHIEAMAVRGDVARAAEAYRAEIAADPGDVTSCERLGQLALRELKDPQLAVWAYREAERRVEAPGRKFGYGLIVAGIYRDQIQDRGKAVVELRRLVERYPDAPRTKSLRAEIEELKAGLFDEPGT